jgi:hypothetical protein
MKAQMFGTITTSRLGRNWFIPVNSLFNRNNCKGNSRLPSRWSRVQVVMLKYSPVWRDGLQTLMAAQILQLLDTQGKVKW